MGLLCFSWSHGCLVPGVAAGATTGMVLIASYYVAQWTLYVLEPKLLYLTF